MSQAYSLASSASAGSQTRQHATWSPYVYNRSLGLDTARDDVLSGSNSVWFCHDWYLYMIILIDKILSNVDADMMITVGLWLPWLEMITVSLLGVLGCRLDTRF